MKYVFYHIPKAGGTTLAVWLSQQFDSSQICPQSFFDPGAMYLEELSKDSKDKIRRYNFFWDHFIFNLAESIPGKSVRFTFLRDPAARVASHFYHNRNMSSEQISQAVQAGRMTSSRAQALEQLKTASLLEYFQNPMPEFDWIFRNKQTQMLAAAYGPSKTSRCVVLKPALAALKKLDCLGLVEMYDESIQLLCFRFGWRYPREIQSLNLKKSSESSELNSAVLSLMEPYVMLDRELYKAAVQEFLKRYRKMVRVLFNKSRISGKQLAEIIQNPFVPAVQERIKNLLDERYYRENFSRFLRAHPHLKQKKNDVLRLTMDQALSGTGWLEREGGTGGTAVCRWTGPGTESTLDFLLTGKKIFLLTITVLEVLCPDILNGLKIYANGRLLSLKKDPAFARGARISAFIYPDMVRDGILRLQLSVPRTMSHFEYNGVPDKRQKGVRISEVLLLPVEKEKARLIPA